MRKPEVEIRMIGPDVAPETVRASDLADFLIHFERAVLAAANTPDEPALEEALVSLVGVDEGSNRLRLALASLVVGAAANLTNAIASGDYAGVPFAAQEALFDISRKMTRKGWAIQFTPNSKLGIVPAAISPEHPVPDPASQKVTGTTTIYGRCVRVGGAEPKVVIRPFNSADLLAISVTEALAKQLAKRLYEEVGLEGQAEWRSGDLKLTGFRAVRMIDYQPTGPVQAFRELAEAAHGRWDGINPVEYVNDLRAGDE
jgi:hypothetical protein